jgi:hypothetical protein
MNTAPEFASDQNRKMRRGDRSTITQIKSVQNIINGRVI